MHSDIMVYVLYSKFIYRYVRKMTRKHRGETLKTERNRTGIRYSTYIVHIVLQHKNAGQIVKKIILKKQHESMDTFCRFDKIY
jgi:hypothetical protein